MKSRSAPGSSTPTSRLTDRIRGPRLVVLVAVLIPVAGFYVIEAFVAPNPLVRIVLRSLPVLPVAVWTLWFDPARPFDRQPATIRLCTSRSLSPGRMVGNTSRYTLSSRVAPTGTDV